MAINVGTTFPQGQSLENPPFFDGTNYNYWKARMRVFIQAMDYDLWKVIVNGPYRLTKIVDGRNVEKNTDEWDEHDLKLIQLNAKATHILYCGLDKNSFAMVYTCESAKEIWDRLEVRYEGTVRVNQSMINVQLRDYDFFEMKPEESITDMFTRFRHIINALHSLGRTYTDDELAQRILLFLPKSWQHKITAIQRRKDFTRLSLEELIGLLETYEAKMKINVKKETEK